VVVLARCENRYGEDTTSPGKFRFGRSGHVVIQNHAAWRRLLEHYWVPDNGAPPIVEPRWDEGTLIVLSIQANSGCGWSNVLEVAEGSSVEAMTLLFHTSYAGPCDMVAREVDLVWIARRGTRVSVHERTPLGKIGVERRFEH
jgi:hypothetical protein